MSLNLSDLDAQEATALVRQWLCQLDETRAVIDEAQRRSAGLHKMIEGLTEMFPEAEDFLPDDFDGGMPRPRGAAAVADVLGDNPVEQYTVGRLVAALADRGWLPDSENPANAVRSAVERLVERGVAQKARSADGAVVYCYADTEPF